MKKHRKPEKSLLMVTPLYLFTIVFVALPLIYIVALSFLRRDAVWGVTNELTLENYLKIFDPVYLKTFRDSLGLAVAVTLISLIIGYPFGYFMAKLRPRSQKLLMLLLVVPFWTNALVRIYGWMVILRTGGVLSNLLESMGFGPLQVLYTYRAILIGMVYALIPFMILPVYSSVEKMDWSVVEAARDLGASRLQAFVTVTLRLTLPGILSGVVLVFIPSMGLFFISDFLGGGKIVLVGNLIKNATRDRPFGAALSIVLMLLTSTCIWLYRKITRAKELEGFF